MIFGLADGAGIIAHRFDLKPRSWHHVVAFTCRGGGRCGAFAAEPGSGACIGDSFQAQAHCGSARLLWASSWLRGCYANGAGPREAAHNACIPATTASSLTHWWESIEVRSDGQVDSIG